MKAKDILSELIEEQDTSNEEIERVCGRLNKIWFQTDSPNKYSVPAHDAEILIRAMQKKDAYRTKQRRKSETDEITTRMTEYICDQLCRYPKETADQDELDLICAGCEIGQFVCDILTKYNRR